MPSHSPPISLIALTFVFAVSTAIPEGLAQSPSGFERPLRRETGLDQELARLLKTARISAIKPGKHSRREMVELGRFLYYDKILSGNRDISCATCHHDRLLTGDACSLSVGTGTQGLGPLRKLGPGRKFTPRNAPDVFNRGLPEWQTMFWDNRVEVTSTGFRTPAKNQLPAGFTHVLQVQAMFPVTSRTEMRGEKGDRDAFGNLNEIAEFADDDFTGIWNALMTRLLGPDGSRNPKVASYRELFQKAYPKTPMPSLGFQHAAAAIAAYERSAYTFLDSPWDRYLAGEQNALNPSAKRGAILFYGNARCASCHSGNLMTDQKPHNLLVPHIGSVSLNDRVTDLGRARETKSPADEYAFRTPPLRNVAQTGPWMHNGTFTTLEAAVKHHFDPIRSFQNYDTRQLSMRELRPYVQNTERDLQKMLSTFSSQVQSRQQLSEAELKDLLQFLNALTSPSLKDLEINVPAQVPSGLPVD